MPSVKLQHLANKTVLNQLQFIPFPKQTERKERPLQLLVMVINLDNKEEPNKQVDNINIEKRKKGLQQNFLSPNKVRW